MNYTTGCIICGKPLVHYESAKEIKCEICGVVKGSNAACEDGHYVCDKCHAQKGYEYIKDFAMNTESRNPVEIAIEMMKSRFVNMHGPEHHFLFPAALLAAYGNSGAEIDLNKSLDVALQRAKNVPGGVCCLWGSCGAGIGAGIFTSVITKANALAGEKRGLANLATAECLKEISKSGGPRCCKRDGYTSLLKAIEFTKEHFDTEMETPDKIICAFSEKNKTCMKDTCSFYGEA